jgi:hypothetical protein
MLALPKIGIARSMKPHHNVAVDVLCDWAEASLAFDRIDFVSGSDILDILHEEEIYDDQSFSWEMIERTWAELERRSNCLGIGSPFKLDGKRIVRIRNWEDSPAYSFCLALACAKWYPNWAGALGKNFTRQGQLFELVTVAALEQLLPSWKIHRTGWAPDNTNKIKAIVQRLSGLLFETQGELEPWVSPMANEAGLDIVCYRPFDDRRPNLPTLFVQCASGKHLEGKLATPDLKEWQKIIQFIVSPRRSFATPLAFTDSEFRRVCNKVDGLLLDRCRLLAAGRDGADWLTSSLKSKLCTWVRPRIAKLERGDE